jgi:putative nucleotidyltransferase with HDIG domain
MIEALVSGDGPRRVLAVHESATVMDELAREFGRAQCPWSFQSATTAAHAAGRLAAEPFDAVICDHRLPDADPVTFLDAVMRSNPRTLRFVFVDGRSQEEVLKLAGSPHHVMTTPWNARQIMAGLDRAFTLDQWATDGNTRRLMWHFRKLPSTPAVYFKVLSLLEAEASLEEVADAIAQDPAITGKLLQVSNSAVLGLGQRVTTVRDALMHLGVDFTRSLLLLAHTFSHFEEAAATGFAVGELWAHSLRTGLRAWAIARAERAAPAVAEAAYTAGLLHDVGKMVFAANLPQELGTVVRRVREEGREWWEVELDVFGATHADVGATIFGIWGLPLSIVEAAAQHHHPAQLMGEGFSALTAVHAANALDHALAGPGGAQADMEYLRHLGLDHRWAEWKARAALRTDEPR